MRGYLCAAIVCVFGCFSARAQDFDTSLPRIDLAKARSIQASGRRYSKQLFQFHDPYGYHSQGDVGSCHAFAAIGLLEAAYSRFYKSEIWLSEADLFLRNTVTQKIAYSLSADYGYDKLQEGNYIGDDLDFAIQNGVATSLDYQVFVDRYKRYRETENKLLAQMSTERKEQGPSRFLYDPAKTWRDARLSPDSRESTMRLFHADSPELDIMEREKVKLALAAFRVRQWQFSDVGLDSAKMEPDACREGGKEQRRIIVQELAKDRPVAVAMELNGLVEGWGIPWNPSTRYPHGFLITGFASNPDQDLVFSTLNSWGGINPAVEASQLCRISAIYSVLTPSERD